MGVMLTVALCGAAGGGVDDKPVGVGSVVVEFITGNVPEILTLV